MLAVDTNLVVRYLTGDDPQQLERAAAIIEAGAETFISLTVLLEAEWVLRSVYRYSPVRVIQALRGFAGLPRIIVEDAAVASLALEWAEAGLDFADALHVAKARSCEAFVTFDEALVRRAAELGTVSVRLP